jgi:2-keto-4-pentenoate hydratase
VALYVDGAIGTRGSGADVLGDPRDALTWLANAHRLTGTGLERGQVVTTGVCGQPTRYRRGQTITVDFGVLGRTEVHIA